MRGPETEPWLYLTFRSGGMLVMARVNLEGGLLGPLVYWIRSLVFPSQDHGGE